MDGDSQEEDETLRNYWTKKKEKKKERGKRKRERRSVSGEVESEDKETQDKHEVILLDSTKLTTLTSVDEGNLYTPTTSEGIPSSIHYNSDDDLRDYNGFESETNSPKQPFQALQDEDLDMEGVFSPNQLEGKKQEVASQENISNLPDQGNSAHQIHPVSNAENTSLAPPQENNSLVLPQENTSILTVDILNDIVKGVRPTSPIRDHTSDFDFFNIKEQRCQQHIHKFRNEDGVKLHYQPADRHAIALSLGDGATKQTLHQIAKRLSIKSSEDHGGFGQLCCTNT
jgi:hypothetical protein